MAGGVPGAGREATRVKRGRACRRAPVHLCLRVCVCVRVHFTSGTFPNFTIVPLQPVVFGNKAPGLTITIRVPTQINNYTNKIMFKE